MNKKFTAVSLFAGAGGLDMGFENVGFHTIWANDNDLDSCNTYRTWSKAEVVCSDISKINYSNIPSADIVLGGFPCQGFSLAGPRKIDDKRNKLYQYFVEVLKTVNPYAFIAENVKGILTLGGGEVIKAIVNDFSERGYIVEYKLHNSIDYGVPQLRHRVVLVGIRKDLNTKFNFQEKYYKKVVLRDVLKIDNYDSNDLCDAPYSSRYMSRNRRKNWDEASFTIPAMAKQVPLHPSSPIMTKIHKDLWKFGKGKTRRFTWREAALIQTFPEKLYFQGNLVSKYKQIGNAVPVKLAEGIASQVYQYLYKEIK